MVILLAQPNGCANGEGQTFQQPRAEVTATEAEAVFIEIELKVFLRQTMIRAQNERLGVADTICSQWSKPELGS